MLPAALACLCAAAHSPPVRLIDVSCCKTWTGGTTQPRISLLFSPYRLRSVQPIPVTWCTNMLRFGAAHLPPGQCCDAEQFIRDAPQPSQQCRVIHLPCTRGLFAVRAWPPLWYAAMQHVTA